KNWEKVVSYSGSSGAKKPSREVAQTAFDELLNNVRIENCEFFPDVVNAMLRRVPGRIEAENYGHGGFNKSYFVKNTLQNSKYYRTSQPVPIELIQTGEGQWHSEQGIQLNSGEWTAYVVNNQEAKS